MEIEALRGPKVEAAFRRLVDSTIPAAEELGLLPRRQADEDEGDYFLRLLFFDGGEYDRRIVVQLAGNSALALKAAMNAFLEKPNRRRDYFDGFAHRAAVNAACLDGIVLAKALFDAARTRKATARRKAMGEETRAKVLKAAQAHRKKPRLRAAESIAAELNMSPDQVRRMLTEAFPGKEWRSPSN